MISAATEAIKKASAENIIISVDFRMGILLIISFSECVAKVPSELV